MKIMLALAHPMIDTPVGDGDYAKLNDPVENGEQLAKRLAKPYTNLTVLGHAAIESKSFIGTTITIHKNGVLQFSSTYSATSFRGNWCTGQSSVFSHNQKPVEKGFALRFLMDYLLENEGPICTDSTQYIPGKKLWERAVAEAYSRGLFVYRTDEHQNLIRLYTLQDFKAVEHSIWGTEELYKKYRVVISKTELEV